MTTELRFETWIDTIQGSHSHEALKALCSPGDAEPGKVIAHSLDIEMTSKGCLQDKTRQWFCLAQPGGFDMVAFHELPDDQKAQAAIAACHLLEDEKFEQWLEERLVSHMNKHGWERAGYGIITIAGAVLVVHEHALSTLSVEFTNPTEEDMSRELLGVVSKDLSHHARLEALHQLGTLFTLYHMSESDPESNLSVFFGDLRVGPADPLPAP